MKLNLFKVKEKKEKKIIIEEERITNPFLLFLKRHKNFILMSGIMIALCLILISTGVAFSLFRGSNDYDISYIEGDETIDSNQDPSVDDEDIKEELLGEIARANGIVLQVKTFMSQEGDVISYFTDGTSIIVRANGKIYRVSTNKEGKYGINENGTIDSTAKYVRVTSTTTTLMDGTIITNYSDGTAKVEYQMQTYFVRDDNNVKIANGSSLDKLAPSGVAPTKKTSKAGTKTLKTFTEGASLISIAGQKYIINKNTEVTATESDINYDTNNIFAVIGEKTYQDGNMITLFANGSAIIEESNGNITYVKRGGDLKIKEQKLYEILPNEYGYSITTYNKAKQKKITYFDNGAAIITNNDGSKIYIEDSDDIVYEKNNNISSNPTGAQLISEKETTDGEKVYNFDNGKSQVIKDNKTSYVIDTDKLTFNTDGEIEDDPLEDNDTSQGIKPNTDDWFDILQKSNERNELNNVNTTVLQIKNKTKSQKTLKITIKEVDDYSNYIKPEGPDGSFSPDYVLYSVSVASDKVLLENPFFSGILSEKKWPDNEATEYTIYDGTIAAQDILEVTIALKPDYKNLYDDNQNKVFAGTIQVYVEDGTER